MASELQLVTISDDDRGDDRSWATTVELLEHLETCWSRFLPTSDVSRLNVACGHPVQVDPSTITLVATMLGAWQATDHRFDPTTLPALVAAGYRASVEDPHRVTILASGAVVVGGFDDDDPTLADIDVDVRTNTVRLPDGIAIDAGGIGKGLAADLAVTHALASGATGAMVSIGGDISTGGLAPEGGWIVHVEHPEVDRGAVGTIALAGGGVATSSTRSRRWHHDGAERHHVIDPWTGAPSTTDLWSVTVVARSGWLAEAHATAALLAGSTHVVEYLDRHELSGVAVAADGRVHATDDLAALGGRLATSSNNGDQR